jgi:F420-0:gamma-glutamyl ligase-like protein
MTRYRVLAVRTEYWKPKEDYLQAIVRGVLGRIKDGDFVIVSEKAISTALGNIIEESSIRPGLNAKLIARCWMRIVWGYFLGRLCHFRESLIQDLREYPSEWGSQHKQVALQRSGLLQALMFGSEGGIDGSNLAYSYVSLPLKNADKVAQEIRGQIQTRLGKDVSVMIVDSDKTYSFKGFHFTPRPSPLRGIHSFGGVFSYVGGRTVRLRRRATPIALTGRAIPVEMALEISDAANRVRGSGSGRTVWDMADRFKVQLTGVSWEMLETAKHKPITIVRIKK